jgi:membrane protein implicated in regulation of membrane protease activity
VINWIVAVVTLFALAFVLIWFLVPRFRARVERPKYRMLANEQRFRKGTSTRHNDFGKKES